MPVTDAIPMPVDLGESAARYLEHHGLTTVVPTIRGSDYNLTCNPRLYYLIRRLGLIPGLSYSKALNRGSWFHVLFGVYDHPDRLAIYAKALVARLKELKAACKAFGIKGEKEAEILAREQKDAATARGWFEATEYVPITDSHNVALYTFQEFCRQPRWRKLGGEVRLAIPMPEAQCKPGRGRPLLVVQYDALLYDQDANKLWIVDPKTSSEDCIERVSTIKSEFNTRHYIVQGTIACEQGVFAREFGIPDNATLGGMVHVPIWKPGIKFGQKDRPFRWISEGLRKKMQGRLVVNDPTNAIWTAEWCPLDCDIDDGIEGGVEGTFDECFAALHQITGKKPDKKFMGEPSLDRFIERLKDAYTGTGDYADKREDRLLSPPVNMSFTQSAVMMDRDWLTEYWDMVHSVYRLATADPHPENFLPGDYRDVRGSEYQDFFTTPVAQWPEIVARNHFITTRRDEDLIGASGVSVDIGAEPTPVS